MMKGVAILLMIFLHLFNWPQNVALCKTYFYIDGTPLIYILTRAANPVSFFLILGGYGLYKVWTRGDRNRWSRLLKLMIHYWIILIIALIVGHVLSPDKYPGSITELIENITAYNTTYNLEMWFLFPYIFLSAISPVIFKICKDVKWWTIIIVACTIRAMSSFIIQRYGTLYLEDHMFLYNIVRFFYLLFSFLVGAIAAREQWFERISQSFRSIRCLRVYAWGGVIICVTATCAFKYFFFYAFCVISLLYLANIQGFARKALVKLGDQSMNMWMIHTWLCYYLFKNFFYGLSYPLLIMLAVTVASYVIGLIIDRIARPIERPLMTKAQIKEKPIL